MRKNYTKPSLENGREILFFLLSNDTANPIRSWDILLYQIREKRSRISQPLYLVLINKIQSDYFVEIILYSIAQPRFKNE